MPRSHLPGCLGTRIIWGLRAPVSRRCSNPCAVIRRWCGATAAMSRTCRATHACSRSSSSRRRAAPALILTLTLPLSLTLTSSSRRRAAPTRTRTRTLTLTLTRTLTLPLTLTSSSSHRAVVRACTPQLVAPTRARAQSTFRSSQASCCCLELMESNNEFRPPGVEDCVLTLHMGIGAGVLSSFWVGGHAQRWEYFVAGEPIEQMSIAADEATSGQVPPPQQQGVIHVIPSP